jgi:hypothetical protein
MIDGRAGNLRSRHRAQDLAAVIERLLLRADVRAETAMLYGLICIFWGLVVFVAVTYGWN